MQMKKIQTQVSNEINVKNISAYFEKTVTNFGNGAKIDTQKEYIGKKVPIKITEIRAVLNRLHYQGIAAYTKTKDSKSGWYYYNWLINKGRVVELIVDKQKCELEKLKQKQNLTRNYDFFACNSACEEIPFEVAAEYNFKCPKCGKSMDLLNNKKSMKTIDGKLAGLEKELLELAEMGKM